MSDNKILYHYCNNKAFESIVRKKQLWMCDISNSNDYSEIRILLPGLFYVAEDLYNSSPFPFRYKRLDNLGAIKLLLNEMEDYITKAYNNGFLTSFVSCFCENGDILSQWWGYSNDGKGCSIGFSLEELKKYCESDNRILCLEKVEYIDKNQLDNIIRGKAQELLDTIKNIKEESKRLFNNFADLSENIQAGCVFFTLSTYVEKMIMSSLKYKWDSFSEELEWRLFFTSISKDEKMIFDKNDKEIQSFRKFDSAAQLLESKVDFIVREDNITTYYPIELMELSDIPIKEVIIGPKNKSKRQYIRLLLAKYGINDAEIKYSCITYC